MPYAETALLAMFAVVIGLVIFGGTTLAAFAEGRTAQSDATRPLRRHPSRSTPGHDVNHEPPTNRAA